MTNNYEIKYVAHYLRKSRGDEDKDLENHKLMLDDISKKNGWKYVEYIEVGTSDDIDMRPKLVSLLEDVKNEIYDAVLVVDYDRFSRGTAKDQERIANTFKDGDTLIITPTSIYDLNNEGDEQIVEFKGFLARQEYKSIVKRLTRGKKFGARRGNWTNGIPPYPYEYERWNDKYNEKGIVVNDEKCIHYREIINFALQGYSTNEIAFAMNNNGVLSPRGTHWNNNTIRRLLIDETHLGKIISNKSSGNGHKKKKATAKPVKINKKEDWIIVENCHEAVKAQEEHDKIIQLLNDRMKVSSKAKKRSYSLSGVVKCGLCGRGTTFTYNKQYEKMYVKPCWYKYPNGDRCKNKGEYYADLEKEIIYNAKKYVEEFEEYINSKEYITNTEELEKQIQTNKQQLDKYRAAIEKLNDAYELGDYTRDEWLKRKDKWNDLISKINIQIEILNRELDGANKDKDKEKLRQMKLKVAQLDNMDLDPKDRNLIYHSLLDYVVFTNDGIFGDLEYYFKNPLPL